MAKQVPQEHGTAAPEGGWTRVTVHQCAAPEVSRRSFEQNGLTSEQLAWDASAQDVAINACRGCIRLHGTAYTSCSGCRTKRGTAYGMVLGSPLAVLLLEKQSHSRRAYPRAHHSLSCAECASDQAAHCEDRFMEEETFSTMMLGTALCHNVSSHAEHIVWLPLPASELPSYFPPLRADCTFFKVSRFFCRKSTTHASRDRRGLSYASSTRGGPGDQREAPLIPV
jgi:hypothetical protein